MSWSLFKTKCMALTGQQHVSVPQFANTVASAYHECMSLHFDSLSGAGVLVNNAPKLPILQAQLLAQCNANLASSGAEVHLLQQMQPFIISYWTGLIFSGPLGVTTVLSPGSFTGLPVIQNTNFNIILTTFINCCRVHLLTLTGQYVSSVVPGVVSPWSGALLIPMP